jgi:hypothetical protein
MPQINSLPPLNKSLEEEGVEDVVMFKNFLLRKSNIFSTMKDSYHVR